MVYPLFIFLGLLEAMLGPGEKLRAVFLVAMPVAHFAPSNTGYNQAACVYVHRSSVYSKADSMWYNNILLLD